MHELGKMIIFFGIIMIIIGGTLLGFGGLFKIGRLPGDIVIKRGNFTFYFPIVTSIILSILLSLIFTLILRR
ncbi:MAG: DUF2905 domain-containing protein [Clostridia bacterium]|nr:DUF2905 domain-containing protein [Clostridia bacterium]